MSSETNFADFPSMLERMAAGGDGSSEFPPVVLALPRQTDDDQESTGAGEMVIHPVNQGVVMIRSDSELSNFLNAAGLEKQGRSPASKSSVENMPRFVIGEDKEKGACSICLEEWSEGDVAAEMPCKHKFHSKCVEEWLGGHATCPVCRYKMPIEEESKKFKVWIDLSLYGGETTSEEDGGR